MIHTTNLTAQLATDERVDLELVWQLRSGGSIVQPMHAVADSESLKAMLMLKMQFNTKYNAWALAVRHAGTEGEPIAVVIG